MRDTQRNESRTKKQPVSEVKGGKSLKKEVASSSKCSWEVTKIRRKKDWFPNDNCFKVMNSLPSKDYFHWRLYSKNLKCCVSCKKTIYNHCNSHTAILWTDFYFRWWDKPCSNSFPLPPMLFGLSLIYMGEISYFGNVHGPRGSKKYWCSLRIIYSHILLRLNITVAKYLYEHIFFFLRKARLFNKANRTCPISTPKWEVSCQTWYKFIHLFNKCWLLPCQLKNVSLSSVFLENCSTIHEKRGNSKKYWTFPVLRKPMSSFVERFLTLS